MASSSPELETKVPLEEDPSPPLQTPPREPPTPTDSEPAAASGDEAPQGAPSDGDGTSEPLASKATSPAHEPEGVVEDEPLDVGEEPRRRPASLVFRAVGFEGDITSAPPIDASPETMEGSPVPVETNGVALEGLPSPQLEPRARRASGPPPRPSLMLSAVRVMEAFDPMSDESTQRVFDDGFVQRPGIVPLAPITLGGVICIGVAITQAVVFSMENLVDYSVPFMIVYGVLLGHLLSYHVAYHTQRRFMAFRQIFFTAVIVAFVNWIVLDLEHRPELLGDTLDAQAEERLQLVFWSNIVLLGLMLLHWLVLGRGHHKSLLRRRAPKQEAPPEAETPPEAAPSAGSDPATR